MQHTRLTASQLSVDYLRWLGDSALNLQKADRSILAYHGCQKFTLASHVGRDLLTLQKLLTEIRLPVTDTMSMSMDNQAAINMLMSEKSMAGAKHVNVWMNFICEFAKKGIVKIEFAESKLIRADLLTKILSAP